MFNEPTMVVNETTGLSTESPFVLSNIAEVIRGHYENDPETGGVIELDTSCLVKVCLGCGSIAMASSQEQRDLIASHYDLTCHPNQTYSFLTHESGITTI